MKLEFLKSAASLEQCPADGIPEIALLGRSNSGKSSFINGLASRTIAKVSQAPGKTRLINFFESPSYRWVDLPGYGFASRSREERQTWQSMVETYLAARGNLAGFLLLIDIRREWSDDEETLIRWLQPRSVPAALVVTKIDKLNQKDLQKQVKSLRQASGVEHVFLTSALKKIGFKELEDFVFQNWIRDRK